jgi:hypothetical protein
VEEKILALSRSGLVEKKKLSFKQPGRSGEEKSSDSSRLDEVVRKKYKQPRWMKWTKNLTFQTDWKKCKGEKVLNQRKPLRLMKRDVWKARDQKVSVKKTRKFV